MFHKIFLGTFVAAVAILAVSSGQSFRSDSTTLSSIGMTTKRYVRGDCEMQIQEMTEALFFQSPNYPLNYPGRISNCSFTVTIPAGTAYKIKFDSHDFSLESGNLCQYDSLAFYDVVDGKNIPFGSLFCGTTGPSSLISKTHNVLVVFNTDVSGESRGFNISAKSILSGRSENTVSTSAPSMIPVFSSTLRPTTTSATSSHTLHNFIGKDCGIKMQQIEDKLFFQSPNYPLNYPGRISNCSFPLRVPAGADYNIKLDSQDFLLEAGSQCPYDSLTFYDVVDGNNIPFGSFCGFSGPYNLISKTHNILVVFNTDGSGEYRGFNISARSILARGSGNTFSTSTPNMIPMFNITARPTTTIGPSASTSTMQSTLTFTTSNADSGMTNAPIDHEEKDFFSSTHETSNATAKITETITVVRTLDATITTTVTFVKHLN